VVSISLAEIVTIALIVFIVFGPKRLPELARRAGRLVRDLRAVAAELRAGIEGDRAEDGATLGDLRRSLGPTLGDSEDDGGPATAPEDPR
jgi:TatA/E family protein of Tat protein translocase